MKEIGRLFIILGIVFIVVGIILWSRIRIPFLGKLPGDIIVKKENFTVYIPIASCVIISIILSLLFWFFSRK